MMVKSGWVVFGGVTGVQIRDTLGVSVSKKKSPAKAGRSKGIELLSKDALLKEAQLKKATKQSKRETNIHQACGLNSNDENDDDDQQSDDERTESNYGKIADLNKTDDEEETHDDKFVHTTENYVPTNDEIEDVDDKEYDRINEEMYSDVNVELKDTELETEVPLPSSSISSDYATKFLSFDNIPSDDTEIISMMDIKVQHEDLSIQTSPLFTIHVLVISETSTAPAITIPPHILPFIALPQQSTPIPTPTSTEATISTTSAPNSKTLSAVHLRLSNIEKEVKELKNVDHSSALLATIKSEVPTFGKEDLETSLDDALYKMLQRHIVELIKEHSIPADVVEKLKQQYKPQKSAEDIRKVKMEHAAKKKETKYAITSSDTVELQEFDQKRTLFKTMTKTKSFNKNTKHKALYHALIEYILEDENAMDKGVTDKSKKRNPDDADKNEGHPTRSNQGLKRKKTSKDDLGEDMGNTDEPPVVKADPKDWTSLRDSQRHVQNYGHLEEIEVRRSDQQLYKFMEGDFPRLYLNDIEDMILPVVQNRLFNLKGKDIVHLAAALRMFTGRIIIQKRVEDLQLGVESYQKKLNISKPRTREEDLSQRSPYTTLSDPQGVIYEDKLNKEIDAF
ncbi:hypothetical protein Tco_1394332 [Tanacetum coccineum]